VIAGKECGRAERPLADGKLGKIVVEMMLVVRS
jgi:hypothetical protein